jgi:hypothetical protein
MLGGGGRARGREGLGTLTLARSRSRRRWLQPRALRTTVTALSWGDNSYCELGDGSCGTGTSSALPVAVCAPGQARLAEATSIVGSLPYRPDPHTPCGNDNELNSITAISAGDLNSVAVAG